ncbi:MAG: peroxiredoxin [Betaproteobacteria bacterium]|jgi:peroxiredoxin Q/BCP|nr:peroxiredoxin [Betaproteobacteria bacterium]
MAQTREHRGKAVLDTPIPDFSLPATNGTTFNLAAQAGKIVVIYFYPKDSTPGCTTQGQNFRDLHDQFLAANAVVLGISRDSVKSHENFKAKQGLPFELGSDADEAICTLFAVMKMKNMYGKQVRGIERSTFVIDRNGVLRREWRGVKVPGHVQEVLDFVRTL